MERIVQSWSEISSDAYLSKTVSLITRCIRARRARGHKNESAIYDTALALGSTPRRVRGFLYGEVGRVARDEYRRLLDRWQTDITAQCAALTAEAARLQEALDREVSNENQYSLPLE